MKQIVKYQFLTIPQKIRCDIRIIVDDKNRDYVSMSNGTKATNISFNPYIGISIVRPFEINEDGRRVSAPYNPNDYTSLSKYSLPVFIRELNGIYEDMKTPELFTYHGKRLELNESTAAKIRRVFINGQTTIELSAVVSIQQDESRVEAIRMKFNNEQSSVVLTLNDVTALLYNLQHLDVDSMAFAMYNEYIEKGTTTGTNTITLSKPAIDTLPI